MEIARFTVFKSDENNMFYFNMRSRSGEVILFSKMFPSRETCYLGINEIISLAIHDHRFERINLSFDYSFILRCGNGSLLARSASYTTSAAREKGIEIIKRDAYQALVENIAEL